MGSFLQPSTSRRRDLVEGDHAGEPGRREREHGHFLEAGNCTDSDRTVTSCAVKAEGDHAYHDAVDAVVESVNDGGDLIVFSHLRWTWVWQRPQQIISRLAPRFDRTIFVEDREVVPDATEPVLRFERCGLVVRAWLEVPGPAGHCGFYDSRADTYPQMLEEYLQLRCIDRRWRRLMSCSPVGDRCNAR